MKKTKQNISASLFKMPVLALYVSFFIVQLFFNFDISNHSNNSYYPNNAQSQAFSGIHKINTGKETRQTIRLNKRFQPQAMLVYNAVTIKAPVHYFIANTYSHYSNRLIPSIITSAQSLRGPPSVVA